MNAKTTHTWSNGQSVTTDCTWNEDGSINESEEIAELIYDCMDAQGNSIATIENAWSAPNAHLTEARVELISDPTFFKELHYEDMASLVYTRPVTFPFTPSKATKPGP